MIKVENQGTATNPSPIQKDPFIIINSPSLNEVWISAVGQKYDITWSNSTDIKNVTIEYSVDNGATWKEIAKNTVNNGFYAWTVPINLNTKQARIRVISGNISSVSNPFSLVPPDTAPKIVIGNPSNNTIFNVGDKTTITWNSTISVKNIYLKYSLDGGNIWVFINNVPVDASTNKYEWLVPNLPSQNFKIKIEDSENSAVKDERTIKIQTQIVGASVISGLVLDVQPIWIAENGVFGLKIQEPTLSNSVHKSRVMLYKGTELVGTDLTPDDGFTFGNLVTATDYKIVIKDDEGVLNYEYPIAKPEIGLTLKFPISLRKWIWNKINILKYPDYSYNIRSSKILGNDEQVRLVRCYNTDGIENLLRQKNTILSNHSERIELEKRLLMALYAQEVYMIEGFHLLAEQKALISRQIEQIFTIIFSFSDILAINKVSVDELNKLGTIKKGRLPAQGRAYISAMFNYFRDEFVLEILKKYLLKAGLPADAVELAIDTIKEMEIETELGLIDNLTNSTNIKEALKAFIKHIVVKVSSKFFWDKMITKFISDTQNTISGIIIPNLKEEKFSGDFNSAYMKSIYYNKSLNEYEKMSESQRSHDYIENYILTCGRRLDVIFLGEVCINGGALGILATEELKLAWDVGVEDILDFAAELMKASQITRGYGTLLTAILSIGEIITAGNYKTVLKRLEHGYKEVANSRLAIQLAFHPSSARSTQRARMGRDDTHTETQNNSDESIIVYPNPSEGKFMIKPITHSHTFHLFDMHGREHIVSSNIIDNELHLDLVQLPNGTYFLTVYSTINNAFVTKKIIKQK